MKQPLKGTAVRIHTVIADIFGNLFNCRGSVRQQNTAFFNAAFFKVFRKTDTGVLLKNTRKIAFGNLKMLCRAGKI